MRRTKLRSNPPRPGTPTMLPDDAGAFQFLSTTQKLAAEGRSSFTLPGGRTVKVKQIGKGRATTAFLGEDSWVYLLTRTEVDDPAKEVLTEIVQSLAPGHPATKHLPWIEHVGYLDYGMFIFNHGPGCHSGRCVCRPPTARRYGEYNLHRMPLYSKLPAHSAAAKQRLVLAQADKVALENGTPHHVTPYGFRHNHRALRWAVVEQVQKAALAGKLPASLAAAVALLSERLDDRTETWWSFEFPARNVMVDEAGNLVLLDVIFA